MPRLAAALLVLSAGAVPAAAGPPTGELRLDIADPVIGATVAGVALRLRVGLDAKDVVELNPAAVSRLPIPFEPGFVAEVGRVSLPGTGTVAEVAIGGRRFAAQLAEHGRDCCAGADGEISPTLLPFARIRFSRARSPELPPLTLAMTETADGLEFADPAAPGLRVQFSVDRPETVATSSAGAVLADAHRGRLAGAYEDRAAAFGVMRPTRLMAFGEAVVLARFAFATMRVRTADFGGAYRLPADPARPGDIVVSRRVRAQEAVPIVLIGRDRLDRCSEILFETSSRRLTLRCGFDR